MAFIDKSESICKACEQHALVTHYPFHKAIPAGAKVFETSRQRTTTFMYDISPEPSQYVCICESCAIKRQIKDKNEDNLWGFLHWTFIFTCIGLLITRGYWINTNWSGFMAVLFVITLIFAIWFSGMRWMVGDKNPSMTVFQAGYKLAHELLEGKNPPHDNRKYFTQIDYLSSLGLNPKEQ